MNEESYGRVFGICQECIEHYLLHRAFFLSVEKTIDCEEKQFLVMSSDAHLQQSILLWCKLFGNDEKTHFTKYVSGENFFKNLYKECGVTKNVFLDYADAFRRFRNKYVAHDEKNALSVPVFDIARDSIFVFDELLKDKSSIIPFGTLREYFSVSQNKYIDIVEKSITT